MILLLAEHSDPHANAIEAQLRERGYDAVFRLDSAQAHHEVLLTIDPSRTPPRWIIRHRVGGGPAVTSENIQAICVRRFGSNSAIRLLQEPDSQHLDQAEVMFSLRRLLDALPERLYPLGRPREFLAAENKLKQLRVAREVGFNVPATLYSNDPVALAEFAQKHELVAVKPLTQSVLHATEENEQTLMWCRAYEGAALAERITRASKTQLYLQEAIPKVADLRIVVLPGHIFACEIDSSSLPADEPDFRRKTKQLPHRLIQLDAPFEAQLRDFLAAMDIQCGSFDFGVTASGQRHFFECNPNGQWLWIERLTGAPIAAAFADTLLAGLRR